MFVDSAASEETAANVSTGESHSVSGELRQEVTMGAPVQHEANGEWNWLDQVTMFSIRGVVISCHCHC